MNLIYENETIISPDGIACRVLDTSKIDFSEAAYGRKSKETIVMKAFGNEKINTVNSNGMIESTYLTNPGEAIFYNNDEDIYVPRDGNGNAWMFEGITNYGYEISEEAYQFKSHVAVKVKSTNVAQVLPEIITIPTCIKDAWGEGAHQFLYEGATLKKDLTTGKVTGIDKVAFSNTWEIIEKQNLKSK